MLSDTRFHNSLWVQAKLSFWTVGLQMLIGVGFALLLNMRSGLLRALRTVFLIPMVLPPIVVAIIWKVLYTPDISPVYWALQALGFNVPALITDPHLGTAGDHRRRHLGVVPADHADGAGGVADPA